MDQMNEEEAHTDEEALAASSSEDEQVPVNLMQAFRERREEIGEDTETLLDLPGLEKDIPGFGTVGLVAKYRRLTYKEIEKIADKVMKSKHPQKSLMAQVDTIAKAMEGMQVRMPDGKIVPLEHMIPGRDDPVLYDNALGEWLGFDPEGSGRRAVMATFNNDLAIPGHHNELTSWMQSSQADDEEDFIES